MSRQLLTAWLNEHRPELAARIANMPLELVRKVLNNETGLNIGPDANIDESCAMFLNALANPKLPPNIGYGIRRRWHAQRGQRNGRGGRYKRMASRINLRKWMAKRLIAEVMEERRGN